MMWVMGTWGIGFILCWVAFYVFELRKRDIETGELAGMFLISIIPLINISVGIAFGVNYIMVSIVGLVKKKYGRLVWRDGKFKWVDGGES